MEIVTPLSGLIKSIRRITIAPSRLSRGGFLYEGVHEKRPYLNGFSTGYEFFSITIIAIFCLILLTNCKGTKVHCFPTGRVIYKRFSHEGMGDYYFLTVCHWA